MKRFATAALAALAAAAAFAAREQISSIQLAPVEKLTQSIVKFFDACGNSAFGPMVAMGVAGGETTNCCGTSRWVFSVDPVDCKNTSEIFDTIEKKSEKAAALPNGVCIRVVLEKKAMDLAVKSLEEIKDTEDCKELCSGDSEELVAYLKGCNGAKLDIAFGDGGLSFDFEIDSPELAAKAAESPFKGGNPLAFAKGHPVLAVASAKGAGRGAMDVWKRFSEALAKRNIKTTGFVKASIDQDGNERFDLDVKAAIGYFKGEGEKAVEEAFESDSFLDEMRVAMSGGKSEKPEVRAAFYVKGIESGETAANAFSRILPESAGKPVAQACVANYYEFLKCVAASMKESGDKNAKMLESILPVLPETGGSGIAAMCWSEGGKLQILTRITPVELRGFGMGISAAMAASAAHGIQQGDKSGESAPAAGLDDDE